MGFWEVWLCEWIILYDEIKVKMMRMVVEEGKKIEIN